MLQTLIQELNKLKNSHKAKVLSRFFKTGKGEYGEGDIFLGITVPKQRAVAKQYPDLPLEDIAKLLKSAIHERRLVGLLILVAQFKKSFPHDRGASRRIINFYWRQIGRINNWDLVDLSAPHIIGPALFAGSKKKLYNLVKSKNLWARRISILSTLYFIRQNKFADTLKISEILLSDQHDLIHKAVGWMLREVGKRDKKILENFLQKHFHKMPRTMLRYAIEKFPETERQYYLKKNDKKNI